MRSNREFAMNTLIDKSNTICLISVWLVMWFFHKVDEEVAKKSQLIKNMIEGKQLK